VVAAQPAERTCPVEADTSFEEQAGVRHRDADVGQPTIQKIRTDPEVLGGEEKDRSQTQNGDADFRHAFLQGMPAKAAFLFNIIAHFVQSVNPTLIPRPIPHPSAGDRG
jgi:hypothetical protein